MEFIKRNYDKYEGDVVYAINPSCEELMQAYAKARLMEMGEKITESNVKHMLAVVDNELESRGYDLDDEDIEPLYDLVNYYLGE